MPQPKAHKYTRKQRLLRAKAWIETYKGEKLYHGYAKHFGVNKLCAILELEMLGIEIDPKIKESVRLSEEQKRIQTEKRKAAKRKEEEDCDLFESDYYFAYIAGYTSNGVPFGITWEEMAEIEKIEKLEKIDGHDNLKKNEDLPF